MPDQHLFRVKDIASGDAATSQTLASECLSSCYTPRMSTRNMLGTATTLCEKRAHGGKGLGSLHSGRSRLHGRGVHRADRHRPPPNEPAHCTGPSGRAEEMTKTRKSSFTGEGRGGRIRSPVVSERHLVPEHTGGSSPGAGSPMHSYLASPRSATVSHTQAGCLGLSLGMGHGCKTRLDPHHPRLTLPTSGQSHRRWSFDRWPRPSTR